jgi:hypothetical protein
MASSEYKELFKGFLNRKNLSNTVFDYQSRNHSLPRCALWLMDTFVNCVYTIKIIQFRQLDMSLVSPSPYAASNKKFGPRYLRPL